MTEWNMFHITIMKTIRFLGEYIQVEYIQGVSGVKLLVFLFMSLQKVHLNPREHCFVKTRLTYCFLQDYECVGSLSVYWFRRAALAKGEDLGMQQHFSRRIPGADGLYIIGCNTWFSETTISSCMFFILNGNESRIDSLILSALLVKARSLLSIGWCAQHDDVYLMMYA